MPGGNPTIRKESLDLGSFLERKRKPLKVWMKQNGIISESALQHFLKNPEWSVTESLLDSIRNSFAEPEKKESLIQTEIQKSLEPEVKNSAIEIDTSSTCVLKDNNDDEILNLLNISTGSSEEVSELSHSQLNKRKEKNR